LSVFHVQEANQVRKNGSLLLPQEGTGVASKLLEPVNRRVG
jgi:hypothetical protein